MPKPDRQSLLRRSVEDEKRKVDDRFARAERVQRSGGLLPGAGDSRTFEAISQMVATGTEDLAAMPAAPVTMLQRAGKTVQALALELLDDNPFNARQIYEPEVVSARALSIAAHGQRVPALVCPNWEKSGRFFLIDGHYRKRALREAGRSLMDCIIDDSIRTPIELYRVSFLANEERNAQSVLDNALAWRRLLDEHVVDSEQGLVALTGMSAATVNKTLALGRLPAAVEERIREHPQRFGLAVGYEIFLYEKLAGEAACVKLVERILAEDLSSRDVARIRTQAADGIPRGRRELSRQYRIEHEGQRIGSLKVRDSGRVVLDVTLADASTRHALLEELKRRFSVGD